MGHILALLTVSPSLISLAYSPAWQMISKQTHVFQLHQLKMTCQAILGWLFDCKPFFTGATLWQAICFEGAPCSHGFVSFFLHWLNMGEASLAGCERGSSRALISCKLWEKQCAASTNVAGAEGFSRRKSLWKYCWCYSLLGVLSK